MPKTSAPPSLRVFLVLLSVSASVTLYHLEISLCLFLSRRSRRCVQAPLGVDESVLMSCRTPWQLLATACQGKPSPEPGQVPLQNEGLTRDHANSKGKNTPAPLVLKTTLPNAQYLYSGVFFILWRPGISFPHDSINIFIDHVCLHFVIFLSL